MGRSDEVTGLHRVASAIAVRLIAMRVRALVAVGGGLTFGYAIVLIRNFTRPDILMATDFTVFWSAWHMILHGHASSLYDESAQRATQQLLMHGGYFEGGLMSFLNPPHFALATVMFGWLAEWAGEPAAFAAWTAMNITLLVLLVRMLLDEWGTGTPQHRLLLAVAFVSFFPVFVTVKNGQLSIALALAVLGAYRAMRAERHWAAGAWLAVLSIKPQLVPVVLLYAMARRSWRVLWAGAVIMIAIVAVTAAALGADVWVSYARQVHYLEQFWGSGTPDYMLNIRGALMRLFGLVHHASIDATAVVIWLAATAGVAVLLFRRRLEAGDDGRPVYAMAVAVGLFTNPHLFIHDTIIWSVPLVLCAASMREAGRQWRPFACFALAWPIVCPLACALDLRSGPFTWFDLHTWTSIAAVIFVAREVGLELPRVPSASLVWGRRSNAGPASTPN